MKATPTGVVDIGTSEPGKAFTRAFHLPTKPQRQTEVVPPEGHHPDRDNAEENQTAARSSSPSSGCRLEEGKKGQIWTMSTASTANGLQGRVGLGGAQAPAPAPTACRVTLTADALSPLITFTSTDGHEATTCQQSGSKRSPPSPISHTRWSPSSHHQSHRPAGAQIWDGRVGI